MKFKELTDSDKAKAKEIYLPDYNTCIEFNGIQHYKPIEYFGGKKALVKQQKKIK